MKKTTKKLSLGAETIRKLSTTELGEVGGAATTAITCTCPKTQYCTRLCTTAPTCGGTIVY